MSPRLVLAGLAAELVLCVCTVRFVVSARGADRALLVRGWQGDPGRRRRVHRERLDRSLRRTRPGRWLGVVLDRGGLGLPWDRGGFGLLVPDVLAAAVVAGALVFVLLQQVLNGPLAVVGVLITPFLVRVLLLRRVRHRTDRMIMQLPDLARSLSNSAAAGLSLRSALTVAVADLTDPVAGELRTVVEALLVGHSIEDALGMMVGRLPSRELRLLVMTLVIQSRVGGNLVGMLQLIVDTLENRRDLRREVRTLTSGVQLSGYLVIALALGSLLLLKSFDAHTLDRLTGSLIGQLALAVSGALFATGGVLVARLSRVEV